MATLCNHFYSHVNYSVTKIVKLIEFAEGSFYSHVNYSVTKIKLISFNIIVTFTVT
mgnify:CR=1 FL=1